MEKGSLISALAVKFKEVKFNIPEMTINLRIKFIKNVLFKLVLMNTSQLVDVFSY